MVDKKIIIGLVGEIASGKGLIVQYLKEKYKATSYRFSEPLRDILNRLYLPINRKNMQTMSQILRENYSQNILAKIMAMDAKKDNNGMVVIDGIRRMADIEYLKEIPEFKLVYVTADMKIRYDRIINRAENSDDNNKTFEQFEREHEAEPELKIAKVGQIAEFKIDNSGTKEELYAQVDKIMQSS